MPNAIHLLSGPVVEPVSLSTAKVHLRVDEGFTMDDALISALISAAREYVENYCNRAIFDQTWQLSLDAFPCLNSFNTLPPYAIDGWLTVGSYFDGFAIKLPVGLVKSISSITYFDGTQTQTLPPDLYAFDPYTSPARIMTVNGQSWPYPTVYTPGTVKVTFVASSYGDGSTVDTCPMSIKQAILLLVGHWYMNREAVGAKSLTAVPMAVPCLLDPYKIHLLGI